MNFLRPLATNFSEPLAHNIMYNIECKNSEVLLDILSVKNKLIETIIHNYKVLGRVIYNDMENVAMLILDTYPKVDITIYEDCIPLHMLAAQKRMYQLLNKLLERGLDINKSVFVVMKHNILMMFIEENDYYGTKFAIEHGADIYKCYGNSLLYSLREAIERKHIKICHLLIDSGFSIHTLAKKRGIRIPIDKHPFYIASENNICELLPRLSNDIDFTDYANDAYFFKSLYYKKAMKSLDWILERYIQFISTDVLVSLFELLISNNTANYMNICLKYLYILFNVDFSKKNIIFNKSNPIIKHYISHHRNYKKFAMKDMPNERYPDVQHLTDKDIIEYIAPRNWARRSILIQARKMYICKNR